MNIPKHIVILGKKVKIIIKPLDEDHGEFCRDSLEIRLNKSLTNKQKVSTLLHECCHAILRIGGAAYNMSEGEEEALIRLLESGLEDIVDFKFNIAP